MKIGKRTVTIKIGDEGDEAAFVFERLKSNVQNKLMYDISQIDSEDNFALAAAMARYEEIILQNCIDVKNFEDENGPISLDAIKRGEVYQDIMQLILRAYYAAIKPQPEAEEKN